MKTLIENKIMNTQVTLNLNKNIIEYAELYAKRNNIDLAKLIENYLNSIAMHSDFPQKISPLVESLTGIISDESIDMHKNYTDYLTKKYL